MKQPQCSPKRRTQPKPDHTYAFQVQDTSRSEPKGFARDASVQTLSLQVLGSLVKQGVSCAPTTGLRKWVDAPIKPALSSHDASCFPWAIVEFKKTFTTGSNANEEKCYCQAANAAAAALELQGQLFDKANGGLSSQLPPVIAFTCVGPIVRVWLAYQDGAGPTEETKKVRENYSSLESDADSS